MEARERRARERLRIAHDAYRARRARLDADDDRLARVPAADRSRESPEAGAQPRDHERRKLEVETRGTDARPIRAARQIGARTAGDEIDEALRRSDLCTAAGGEGHTLDRRLELDAASRT